VPVALALALALVLAGALGEVEAADEEDEDEELLQPAAASPMHAMPSSAASRVDVFLRISTPTTIATPGCALQSRETRADYGFFTAVPLFAQGCPG
jgi:hypothetical protein